MFANLAVTRHVFEYAAKKRLTGAFLSLDQAKAFDRQVGLLYRDLTSSVVINGSATARFRYTRGIGQGYSLGPTFFIISIQPLFSSLAGDARIRGLPMTGSEEIKILAYADDVSLFVRYAQSLEQFRRSFNCYASFPNDSIGRVEVVSTVKVLGICALPCVAWLFVYRSRLSWGLASTPRLLV
ncbi:hypothetical protein HPB52_023345 [Rhipicephalus sanguineus]|uniref:Reverse transcriptase domain-containing protein n=1 Tax=Rhipicephalus sanguineus TaxID=34632 RepID=A0A9D4QCC2_RHISA|nr:hypothetical protein HPB52_023345 [Rhipicephalus sanguineus]